MHAAEPYPPFSIATRRRGETDRVVVSGELDRATGPRLSAVLHDRLIAHRHVVLDLSAVTFIDAGGVEVVWEAAREAAAYGSELDVRAGASAAVARALRLTGVAGHLTLVD
jgi:anti-anti-sigma factor